VVLPDGPLPERTDWRAVFRHELAHLRRGDAGTALLAEARVGVFFWQPVAWAVRRRLLRAAVFACDDWVLAGGADGPDYAETLLGLVPATNPLPAVPTATGLLTARIRRMLRPGPVPSPELPRGRCRLALGCALVLTAGIALFNARPGPRTGPATADRPTVARLGR
jgi:beta-lactamase regulating signal transducer with metallopeptidase domain